MLASLFALIFSAFDYIVVMDDSNYGNVLDLDPRLEFKHKVVKMTEFTSDNFSDFTFVPDPYFGGEEGFNTVLDLLENTCSNFLVSITS